MQLTTEQTDALTELINIGYGRAAGALSEMTRHRIKLAVPEISLLEIDEVGAALARDLAGETVCVNQVFTGPFAGNAMLLLDAAAALMLHRLLADVGSADTLDTSTRDSLVEAGNVVLSACLGAFGNLLEVQVTFSIPHLHVESVSALLNSITMQSQDLTHALIMRTQFELRAGNVRGYFVIIFGITSLQRVLDELDRWEHRSR